MIDERTARWMAATMLFNPTEYEDRLVKVQCEPMPPKMRVMAEAVCNPNDCYRNVFRMLSGGDMRYVAAIGASVISIDHAILKVGDTYYDPTWELYSDIGSVYWVVKEFSPADIGGVVLDRKCNTLPRSEEVLRDVLKALSNN